MAEFASGKTDAHVVDEGVTSRNYTEDAPGSTNFAPLHLKLKSRHLQMIAIGGIIGPGLLVGSGNALRLAGPGGILISFALVGIIVFFVMCVLPARQVGSDGKKRVLMTIAGNL
jgi:yeast amino acid transporter